jgi:hypothetical protein
MSHSVAAIQEALSKGEKLPLHCDQKTSKKEKMKSTRFGKNPAFMHISL